MTGGPRTYPDPAYRAWVASTWLANVEKSQQDGLPFATMQVVVHCKNGTYRTVLGYLPEEVQGQHAHRLFHHTRADGTPYPEETCAGHAALRFGRAISVDNGMFWRKDSSGCPVLYTVAPMVISGVTQGEELTFHDTTLEARTRQELIKKEGKLRKAQEIVRTLGGWDPRIAPAMRRANPCA
jgi:hypothetical protein